jgi:hypothetical protein
MNPRDILSRKLGWLLGAFALGLLTLLVAVAVLDSRAVAAGAMVALIVVGAIGYHWFRCPFCGHSILHYTVREVRAWLEGGPRYCPFCESDLDPSAIQDEPVPTEDVPVEAP